jgi:drug/metabolite transporter (DMT)-like permease
MLMKALEYTAASTIQPFNYFTLVWAIMISVVYFDQWPDYWTMAGAVVIICSGLFVIKRTQMRKATSESASR